MEEYDQDKILSDVGFYTNGGVITESNQSQFADGGAALSKKITRNIKYKDKFFYFAWSPCEWVIAQKTRSEAAC